MNMLFDLEKEKTAIDLLRKYEPVKGYFLNFSGGKESVVLEYIARMSGVKYHAYFANTTVEAPETMKFISKNYPDVEWLKPKKTMRQLIIEKQYPPTRIVRYCCEYLKECYGSGYINLTGIRKYESSSRSKRKQIEVDYKDNSKIFIHPLFFWKTEEIWEYIKDNSLAVNPLYHEGFKRIGCVMCPFSGSDGMKRDAVRWPKIAKRYREYFQETYDYWKAKGKNWKRWKSGDCIYQWWIEQPKSTGKQCLFVEGE